MTGEEAFRQWRSAAGPWAQWIKPSLFAQAFADIEPVSAEPRETHWLPATADTALVLDLEGTEAVELGVALAARGLCPVPLFNTTPGERELVDTRNLTAMLLGTAARLGPRTDGPPVFLLDASRQRVCKVPMSGDLDNRWFVFASDLPTAEGFSQRGIHGLVIVSRPPLATDVRLFSSLASDLGDALAGHAALCPTVLDPDSRECTAFPQARPALLRGLSRLGRTFHKNLDGSFGHRIAQGASHG